ncbi:MDC1 protein, partial [Menura novaehollandiae]|nr:MDC1 protein [Menura novaehollandiae]
VGPPNPDVEGSRRGRGALMMDSDTDVEEEGADPDVGSLKRPETAPNVPETPDVAAKPQNPDVPGPKIGRRLLLVDSDTDVEEDPDVGPPKRLKRTQTVPETPGLGAETPDPDIGGPKSRCGIWGSPLCPSPQVRRSQRLAKSRRGGASADPAPDSRGRVQVDKPRPLPRLRPSRRRAQVGVAGVEFVGGSAPISIKGGGWDLGGGMVSPLPPPLQGEEAEPAEGARRKLRPRTAPGPAHIRVLFTGLVATPAMLVALGTLGGTEATSVHDCSHLVTDGIRRTLKFLCAMARGVPISSRGGRVLAPEPFLLRDPPRERLLGFRLGPALVRARGHPLLKGYKVHVTPSVRPCPKDMRDIVICCGGTFLPALPRGHVVRGHGDI